MTSHQKIFAFLITIGAITILESIALIKGIDGAILSGVVGGIATAFGYLLGRKSSK